MPEFSAVEDKVAALIAKAFGVSFRDYAPIKRADLIALATEKRDLMPYSTEDWDYLQGIEPLPEVIRPMSPMEAKVAFLDRYSTLTGKQVHQGLSFRAC